MKTLCESLSSPLAVGVAHETGVVRSKPHLSDCSIGRKETQGHLLLRSCAPAPRHVSRPLFLIVVLVVSFTHFRTTHVPHTYGDDLLAHLTRRKHASDSLLLTRDQPRHSTQGHLSNDWPNASTPSFRICWGWDNTQRTQMHTTTEKTDGYSCICYGVVNALERKVAKRIMGLD